MNPKKKELPIRPLSDSNHPNCLATAQTMRSVYNIFLREQPFDQIQMRRNFQDLNRDCSTTVHMPTRNRISFAAAVQIMQLWICIAMQSCFASLKGFSTHLSSAPPTWPPYPLTSSGRTQRKARSAPNGDSSGSVRYGVPATGNTKTCIYSRSKRPRTSTDVSDLK